MTSTIDLSNWCNSNPENICFEHIFNLTECDEEFKKCIVCNNKSLNNSYIRVLYKPKNKYLVKKLEKQCYTSATVSVCNSMQCNEIIRKVNNELLIGRDWWDIYDEIIHSIHKYKNDTSVSTKK